MPLDHYFLKKKKGIIPAETFNRIEWREIFLMREVSARARYKLDGGIQLWRLTDLYGNGRNEIARNPESISV